MAVTKTGKHSESSPNPAPELSIESTASLRLAAIVDSSDDAIISMDMSGTILSWNAAAEHIFGYEPQEIIGKSILTIIPQSLQHEEADILGKLSAGEKIEHFETIRRRKDGGLIDVSLTISPIKDNRDVVIGASKIARDVSERRRADEATFRLAAIVESSDDAIVSKNLDGIITSWNAAAERLFGWSAEEIIGRSILTIIPDNLQQEEYEILRRLQAGQRIDHFETTRQHKNGHPLQVSVTISPIRDSSGRVIGASKIARDVSEHKRMQQALIESEKLAATGRLAAAIAHEINNPLESVTNLAYLLSIDTSLNGTARRYAELMLQEISRANEITKQTLAYYRDTGKPAEVRLSELLDNVLELNRPRIRNKRLNVEREYETDLKVFGLAAEIRQVIANLLLNAMDAVREGGTIRVRLGRDSADAHHRVRLSIADNGHGIDPQARGRIFEPFFTTKGNQGNGLGLWVSKGIVEKHGGKILLRSVRDRGTVFSIILPVLQGEDQPSSAASKHS